MLIRWVWRVVILGLAFAAGAILTGRLQSREEIAEQRSATPAPVTPAHSVVPGGLPDFTQVASRTAPAVVNISATQVVRRYRDPFFGGLFGGDEMFQRGTSAGSGVIVSNDGYVLTNNHVLGEAAQNSRVSVILSDKRERPAAIVGSDPWTDLALLKIEEGNLPTIPWGDSGALRVADWVLAIGNPYQLGQSVTLGIVSGINRNYEDVSALVDYIQTDAAINRGNSGGALINKRGELVGINTWILSESGGDQGIGFAIPSNLARSIADEIIKYGEVRRGTIGVVRLAAVTPELARDLGLSDERGALVWSLYNTSPAYRAGLRPGDIIVSVNATRVDSPAQLQRRLLEAPVGSVVALRIVREGREQDIRVQVESHQSSRRRNAA